MASGMWRSLTRQMYSVVSLAKAGANCSPKLSDKSWIWNGNGNECGNGIRQVNFGHNYYIVLLVSPTVPHTICRHCALAWSLIYFGLPSVSITNKFATTCAKQVQSNWAKRQWEGTQMDTQTNGRGRGCSREREGGGGREVATLTVADNNVDNTSFYFRLHKLFNTKDK